MGDPARMGLPPRCDREWFCNTFCAGVKVTGSACWPYIRSFNMYDPLALIVTIPALRERFFEPKKFRVRWVRAPLAALLRAPHRNNEEHGRAARTHGAILQTPTPLLDLLTG